MAYKSIFPKQPKIKIPVGRLELILEALSLAGLVIMAFMIVKVWAVLPDTIPSHFNAAGQPDGYGGKGSLIMLPLMGLVLYMTFGILRFYPHVYNYPCPITEQNAEFQYRLAIYLLAWMKIEVIWCFLYINAGTIKVAMGQSDGLGPQFIFIMLFAVFGTIGWYFFVALRNR
jgi:uncharacterized membrane protein